MDDLITRLRAKLDEVEERARAASPGPWRHNPAKQWHRPEDLATRRNGEEYVARGPLDAPVCVAVTGPADDEQSMADAAHVAAQNPDATLRMVAAHRKILDEHRLYPATVTGPDSPGFGCGTCDSDRDYGQGGSGPCATVLAVAEGYGIVAP